MPRTAKPHQVAPDLDPTHDAGFAAASERAARALDATHRIRSAVRSLVDPNGTREIRVGTASWTDPTITKGGVFYPRGVTSSEDRLRYYASQFPDRRGGLHLLLAARARDRVAVGRRARPTTSSSTSRRTRS